MTYLGIDFGLAVVGLSLASGPLAEPLGQKRYQSETKLLKFLAQVINDHQVSTIVLGLPEGSLAPKVKTFSKKLEAVTGLPVIFEDETLTSKEAVQKLLQAMAPVKKCRLDHQAAATLILQQYLDQPTKA